MKCSARLQKLKKCWTSCVYVVVKELKKLLQFGLRFYKRWVSPMLPGACRFVPTCSEYAAEAVEYHGVLGGRALTLWVLLRFHPFARGGYGPVPVARQQDCNRPPPSSSSHSWYPSDST